VKLIRQSFEVLTPIDADAIMRELERSTRLCYKSEDKIGPGTADKLVRSIIKNGHHAMLEHQNLRFRFITDRGVTHELVRHRLCAVAQESTRYCNYSKGKFGGECTFIIPSWFSEMVFPEPNSWRTEKEAIWSKAMHSAEFYYMEMIRLGQPAQQARSVLPNSLKTEIDVTANIRQWRHILNLRTAPAAHPQMRDLMLPLLALLKEELPILFSDVRESL